MIALKGVVKLQANSKGKICQVAIKKKKKILQMIISIMKLLVQQ